MSYIGPEIPLVDILFDLCSPHILAYALNPVTKLVDTCIPVLQSIPHAFNLCQVQNPGLHPVDLSDLANLVNSTL